MLHEAVMFEMAKAVQGVVMPTVVCFGKLASTHQRFNFLATSLVEGTTLSSIEITPSIAAAAAAAVQQLHGCGLVHGDLTLSNMILVQQQAELSTGLQQPSPVMLLDLGRAMLATAEECQKELERLNAKLAKCVAVTAATTAQAGVAGAAGMQQ